VSTYIDLGDLEREIRGLRTSVSDLESRCATLAGQAEEAERARAEMAAQVETLEEQARDTEEANEATAAELAEIRQQLRNLTGRLRWLEHHVTTAEGLEPADLGAMPAAPQLATRIKQGDRARAALLADTERQQLSGQVAHYEQLRQLQLRHRDEALGYSEIIAATAPGDADRGDAADRFATARDQHKTFAAKARQQKSAADAARARLLADDRRRGELGPAITDGENAQSALRTEARVVVSGAVERRALLPVWFTTALGYEPPPSGAGLWLEAAAGLLAYRVAYGISDAVTALGPRVDEAADPGRARWRGQLERELARASRMT
jgi:hypothetical protein